MSMYVLGPRWINLYGAPLGIHSSKMADRMNMFPDSASTYRGRLLLSLRSASADEGGAATERRDFIHRKRAAFVGLDDRWVGAGREGGGLLLGGGRSRWGRARCLVT